MWPPATSALYLRLDTSRWPLLASRKERRAADPQLRAQVPGPHRPGAGRHQRSCGTPRVRLPTTSLPALATCHSPPTEGPERRGLPELSPTSRMRRRDHRQPGCTASAFDYPCCRKQLLRRTNALTSRRLFQPESQACVPRPPAACMVAERRCTTGRWMAVTH